MSHFQCKPSLSSIAILKKQSSLESTWIFPPHVCIILLIDFENTHRTNSLYFYSLKMWPSIMYVLLVYWSQFGNYKLKLFLEKGDISEIYGSLKWSSYRETLEGRH